MSHQPHKKIIKRSGALLDTFVSRIISRKFLVWVAGTYFAMSGMLSGDNGWHWIIVSCVYIGAESVIDYVQRLKFNSSNSKSVIVEEIEEPTLEKNEK